MADNAAGFFLAPVGGAVVGFVLSFRWECEGAVPYETCNNILGFPALALNSAQTFMLCALLAGIGFGVFTLWHWIATSGSRPDVT